MRRIGDLLPSSDYGTGLATCSPLRTARLSLTTFLLSGIGEQEIKNRGAGCLMPCRVLLGIGSWSANPAYGGSQNTQGTEYHLYARQAVPSRWGFKSSETLPYPSRGSSGDWDKGLAFEQWTLSLRKSEQFNALRRESPDQTIQRRVFYRSALLRCDTISQLVGLLLRLVQASLRV